MNMEPLRKNLVVWMLLIGFAGTFIGIGVGWADIKRSNEKGEENSRQIADIRANGTELSRRDRETQATLHLEVNRRIEVLEKIISEYGTIRIEVAQTRGEIIEIKERLSHILALLDAMTTRKP
jgi:hypothetical protein